MAFALVVMKVLEQLVERFLKSITRDLLDLLQFVYHENQLVDVTVSLALFFICWHFDCPNRCAYIHFLNFRKRNFNIYLSLYHSVI